MEMRKPTWGTIGLHLLLWFLMIIIALLSSCGMRKSSVDIKTTDNKEKTEISSEGKEQTSEETKKTEETANVSNVQKEAQVTRTTSEYDKDTGKLIKTITETENKKSTKNTSKNRKSTEESKKIKYVYIKVKELKTVRSHTYDKNKDTERSFNLVDQVGGSGVVIAIVIIIVGAIFAFKFLNKP